MSCQTCLARRFALSSETGNLTRVARIAVRNETSRNLAFVTAAKAAVKSAKTALAEHEAQCEVAA
ncbi:hypothetical protein V1227_18735 [Lentzea sp. DG1S-22]|uniref:hypothetical protein n=1 Tax=Lentzea sp. DG1S-22 TaxID=3108822 RepID=UPI002E75A9C3|nr:hypothetical protein [Lentzea sp. DG1S-22]WVH84692.1 hypothetical protein V1227_18735 [Lentzea sp. DG1S-22]